MAHCCCVITFSAVYTEKTMSTDAHVDALDKRSVECIRSISNIGACMTIERC